jgi:hypothetical protein
MNFEFDNCIRSLSQNLQDLVQQETISAEDLDDMKSSVTTETKTTCSNL